MKEAIDSQTPDNLLKYIPKIEIVITKVPDGVDSELLELSVDGLNVETAFRFSPGEEIKCTTTASLLLTFIFAFVPGEFVKEDFETTKIKV